MDPCMVDSVRRLKLFESGGFRTLPDDTWGSSALTITSRAANTNFRSLIYVLRRTVASKLNGRLASEAWIKDERKQTHHCLFTLMSLLVCKTPSMSAL